MARQKTPNKTTAVFAAIEEGILSGRWPIGSRITPEVELAQEFGCSRDTVSKAIARLAHTGLVERKPGAGTHVLRTVEESAPPEVELDAFAFIYPSDQHEGIWRSVQGFQQAAKQNDRRVVMLTTGTDYRKEAEYIRRLSEFHVRGAVIWPNIVTPEDQAAISQLLTSTKFPIVLSQVNMLGLGCPAVTVDAFHAGYTMTQHLLKQGLRRIGYFANRAGSISMRDRYMGYRKAMEEAGAPILPDSVMLDPSMSSDFKEPLRAPSQLAEHYLQNAKNLEGVVCNTDFLAVALIKVARSKGLRVPQDLKVTGIDNYTIANDGDISLTTYTIPCEELGRMAFETLSRFVAKEISPATEIQIRGQIVVRESA